MVQIILHKIKLLPYLLLIVLTSCKIIVVDYKIKGEKTFKGSIENDVSFHEHLVDSEGYNYCCYHQNIITEDFEITIENIKKVRKLVWYKK